MPSLFYCNIADICCFVCLGRIPRLSLIQRSLYVGVVKKHPDVHPPHTHTHPVCHICVYTFFLLYEINVMREKICVCVCSYVYVCVCAHVCTCVRAGVCVCFMCFLVIVCYFCPNYSLRGEGSLLFPSLLFFA